MVTAERIPSPHSLLRQAQPSFVIFPAHDPLSLGAVALRLIFIGLAACWLPAWRATKVDPLRALRAE